MLPFIGSGQVRCLRKGIHRSYSHQGRRKAVSVSLHYFELVFQQLTNLLCSITSPACFTCTSCKDTLTGSYVEKDSKIFCKPCYEKSFLPPCYACKKSITPEAGSNKLMAIEWKEKKFHVACFACKMCSQPFSDLKAVLHKDDLLCKACFEKIS